MFLWEFLWKPWTHELLTSLVMLTSAFRFRGFPSCLRSLPSFNFLIWFCHLENVPQHPWMLGMDFFFFFLRDGQLVTSPGSHSHLSSKQRQLYRLRTLPTSFATLFLASKPRNWDLVQGCVAPYTLVFWFFLEGPERSAYFSHPPRFGGYSGFGYYPFPWKGETPVRFLLTVSP